jgi:hypothetical protein
MREPADTLPTQISVLLTRKSITGRGTRTARPVRTLATCPVRPLPRCTTCVTQPDRSELGPWIGSFLSSSPSSGAAQITCMPAGAATHPYLSIPVLPEPDPETYYPVMLSRLQTRLQLHALATKVVRLSREPDPICQPNSARGVTIQTARKSRRARITG